MKRAMRLRLPQLAALFVGLTVWITALPIRGQDPGAGEATETKETVERGRALFARDWVTRDRRSRGGDGLGPVYNERSCLGCHQQGGPGGAAGADRNIEIITAVGEDGAAFPNFGAFYSFGMSFGDAGFQYRFASNPSPTRPRPLNPADLAQIHPGFREAPSVVLHRYGPDADYRAWRTSIPGRHGAILIRTSQRNPTPLFGLGLVDAIPGEVLEAASRRRFAAWPQVRGRVSRLADGRVGRFGWKAQTATLEEFALSAAAVELGLEAPGRRQAGDPRVPPLAAPGLDLDGDDVAALVAYLRDLPAPVSAEPDSPKEAHQVKAGSALFKSIGCAACHLPKLGDVEGLYSDLLLHDMSPQLADTSFYGAFAARDDAPPAPRHNTRVGAAVQEWRTPPLWGLRDSAPYLHDGRAETIDAAIRGHGGQAAAQAHRYAQLSARERAQLDAFLLSLAAPDGGGDGGEE